MKSSDKFTDVYFDRKDIPFEYEVMTLSHLFSKGINLLLSQPQKLHFYFILIITDGKGVHKVDFKEYNYTAGNLIFVAPGQINQFVINDHSNGFLVLFTENFYNKSSTDINFLSNSLIFDPTLESALVHPDEAEFILFQTGLHFVRIEFSSPFDWATEDILHKYLGLLLLFNERVKKRNHHVVSGMNITTDYQRLKIILENNFMKQRNVEFYAENLNVSAKKLNRITQTVIGKSAKQLIDDRIILEMKRLILYSGLSIKEISFKMNFDEPTNMVKYFKKTTGFTPLEFRANEKKLA